MKSVAPETYPALPSLARPAAYICVLRDVDSDRYRIEATSHPKSLIDRVSAEQRREFGLELLSIVETDDIDVSEARLFERHHARLGAEWLALDDYQLRELQKSELQVYAHRSQYIRPDPLRQAKTSAPAVSDRSGRAMDGPRRRSATLKTDHQPTLDWQQYGANALKRNRGGARDLAERNCLGLREKIDNALTDLWHNHPWKCLLALALLLLVSLAAYERNCSNLRYPCPTRRSTTNWVDRSPTPTPSRQVYVVNRMATARACPLLSCDTVARWPAGTEVRSRGTRRGDAINGNDLWIIFGFNGRSVAIHSNSVTPKR